MESEQLNIYDWETKDMDAIKKGISEGTYWHDVIINLNPFLYYVLMLKEEEVVKEAQKTGKYNFGKWNAMMFTKQAFEIALSRVPKVYFEPPTRSILENLTDGKYI